MDWLIYAILTTISWGLFATFIKKSYTSQAPILGVLTGAIAATVILIPFAFLNHARLILPLIPIGIIVSAAYIFLYYALDKGKLALTATVQSTYPLFTIIFAFLFLHEHLSSFAKLGVLIILVGLVFISVENPKTLLKIKPGSWLWWGISSSVLAGFGDFLSKVMVVHYDAYSYSLSFAIGWVIVATILALIERKKITSNMLNKDGAYSFIGSGFMFLGYLFFYLAFRNGLASVVVPITGSYSVVSLVLGIFWLKEKITKYQLLGAAIILVGIIAVSNQ